MFTYTLLLPNNPAANLILTRYDRVSKPLDFCHFRRRFICIVLIDNINYTQLITNNIQSIILIYFSLKAHRTPPTAQEGETLHHTLSHTHTHHITIPIRETNPTAVSTFPIAHIQRDPNTINCLFGYELTYSEHRKLIFEENTLSPLLKICHSPRTSIHRVRAAAIPSIMCHRYKYIRKHTWRDLICLSRFYDIH